MFKKIIAVSTATMLTIAMSATAFAAVTVDDLKAVIPASYHDELDKEIAELGGASKLTEAQIQEAIDTAKEVKKELQDAGIKTAADLDKVVEAIQTGDESKLPAGLKLADVKKTVDSVTDKVEDAAKSVGIKVSLTVKEGSDSVIGETSVWPEMGSDFSTTVAVVAGLGVAVAGVAVVARKKDLVNA